MLLNGNCGMHIMSNTRDYRPVLYNISISTSILAKHDLQMRQNKRCKPFLWRLNKIDVDGRGINLLWYLRAVLCPTGFKLLVAKNVPNRRRSCRWRSLALAVRARTNKSSTSQNQTSSLAQDSTSNTLLDAISSSTIRFHPLFRSVRSPQDESWQALEWAARPNCLMVGLNIENVLDQEAEPCRPCSVLTSS